MESSHDISLEFAGLRLRLLDLTEIFNPHGADLRLGPPLNAHVSPEFWDEVESLARDGIETMKLHRVYFMTKDDPPRLSSDGGFWHKRIYPMQMWLDGIIFSTSSPLQALSGLRSPFLRLCGSRPSNRSSLHWSG